MLDYTAEVKHLCFKMPPPPKKKIGCVICSLKWKKMITMNILIFVQHIIIQHIFSNIIIII